MSKAIEADLVRRYIDDPGAAGVLTRYFDSGKYTGGRFERFAGGGDRPEVAGRFTAEDIVAVSLLSVRIPGRPALRLIEDPDGSFAELLGQIPTDLALHEVDSFIVDEESPAARLWSLLEQEPGIGWVTAGKLLARKRPALLPVYDRVVRAALERSREPSFWIPLRDVLAANPGLVKGLQDLRAAADVGEDISLLRVLDVVIWMLEHGQPEPTPDSDEPES